MATRLQTPQFDHVNIRGVRIELDSIVDARMLDDSAGLTQRFCSNVPFPHIVIDGLFSPDLLELVEEEFEHRRWTEWDRYDSADEVKRGSNRHAVFGPATQLYFNSIHSRPFVRFLEHLSEIPGLLPDPQLFAGGMHEIPDGGHFSVHIDFNRHPLTQLSNRLVLITYLNKGWQRSYGGALELWSATENCKVVDVDPLFGRTIIFAQSRATLHGHPVPVHAPDGRPRRSVAAYYYSSTRPDGEEDDASFRTTVFAVPPRRRMREKVTRLMRYVVPPIAFVCARKVGSALRR